MSQVMEAGAGDRPEAQGLSRRLLSRWELIVDAMADIDASIAEVFAREGADLPELRSRIISRLVRLGGALDPGERANPPPTDLGALDPTAARVIEPLTFLIDEVVLARIDDHSMRTQLTWRHVQIELFGETRGGDRFYDLLDALPRAVGPQPTDGAASAPADPILPQVYAYCMARGFAGRHPPGDRVRDLYLKDLHERLGTASIHTPKRTWSRPDLPMTWVWYAGSVVVAGAAWLGVSAVLAQTT